MSQIKIAPIVPFSIMESVSKFSDASLYLFHEIENLDYKRIYLSDLNYKIIDNGTFELGKLPEDENYIKISVDLSPNEIVTPDLLKNFLETKKRTLKFLNKYHNVLNKKGIKLQAVVQAKNLQDAIDHYLSISKDSRIHCIGLPFKMELKDGKEIINREQFIELLINKKMVSSKPHHLLGLNSIQELIRLSKHSFIRSCDSSIFYRDSRDGINYTNGIPNKKSGSRINLYCKEDKKCLELLKQNLEIVRPEMLHE